MAISKQYHIEVRGEFEPQNDVALRVQMQKLAQQAQTLAKMLSVSPSTAMVALYSDDFFDGHGELGLNPADVPERQVYEVSIDELEISVRTLHCFKNAECYGFPKIEYLSDVLQYTSAELMRIPNLGKGTLNEIKEMLDGMGLSLKGEA